MTLDLGKYLEKTEKCTATLKDGSQFDFSYYINRLDSSTMQAIAADLAAAAGQVWETIREEITRERAIPKAESSKAGATPPTEGEEATPAEEDPLAQWAQMTLPGDTNRLEMAMQIATHRIRVKQIARLLHTVDVSMGGKKVPFGTRVEKEAALAFFTNDDLDLILKAMNEHVVAPLDATSSASSPG